MRGRGEHLPLAGTVASNGTRAQPQPRSDWSTLRRLFPYLWRYKWRVIAALAFMVGAKLANVGVPVLLKELVDRMDTRPADALWLVPAALLLAYGALRFLT